MQKIIESPRLPINNDTPKTLVEEESIYWSYIPWPISPILHCIISLAKQIFNCCCCYGSVSIVESVNPMESLLGEIGEAFDAAFEANAERIAAILKMDPGTEFFLTADFAKPIQYGLGVGKKDNNTEHLLEILAEQKVNIKVHSKGLYRITGFSPDVTFEPVLRAQVNDLRAIYQQKRERILPRIRQEIQSRVDAFIAISSSIKDTTSKVIRIPKGIRVVITANSQDAHDALFKATRKDYKTSLTIKDENGHWRYEYDITFENQLPQ